MCLYKTILFCMLNSHSACAYFMLAFLGRYRRKICGAMVSSIGSFVLQCMDLSTYPAILLPLIVGRVAGLRAYPWQHRAQLPSRVHTM